MSNLYPRKEFQKHLRELRWKQGEHVLLCGPTGAGKTTLVAPLIEKRAHVVILVSKMKDPTFETEFKGYKRLTSWPKGGPRMYENRVLLWPEPEQTVKATLLKQREVFGQALNEITRQGKRCVVVDESLMMTDPKLIGLGTEIGMMHYYGRSAGISMVDLTQRPSWIPKVIYSSVSHAYVARTRDDMDMRRLGDMGGVDRRIVRDNLLMLPDRHDYLYLNPQGDANPHVVNTRQ